MNNSSYTVFEITKQIKTLIEPTLSNVVVSGEITEISISSAGHAYFSLKDSKARLSGVIFSRARKHDTPLSKGTQVEVFGSIRLYEPSGNYQIVANSIKHAGKGTMLLEIEKRKQRLLENGFFNKEAKKRLPRSPKVIGIVTSESGSVFHDILHVLEKRQGHYNVLLCHAAVQGVHCEKEVINALEHLDASQACDVIIIARGGGSFEDLLPFQSEHMSHAIFHCKTPVITAIGHETDTSIVDYVSDMRAPTPSAAAEYCSYDKKLYFEHLEKIKHRTSNILHEKHQRIRAKLLALKQHLLYLHPLANIERNRQKIDAIESAIHTHIKESLHHKMMKLENAQQFIKHLHVSQKLNRFRKTLVLTQESLLFHNPKKKIDHFRTLLKGLQTQVTSHNSSEMLKKGFSIIRDENGNILKNSKGVTLNQKISITLYEGEIHATVTE